MQVDLYDGYKTTVVAVIPYLMVSRNRFRSKISSGMRLSIFLSEDARSSRTLNGSSGLNVWKSDTFTQQRQQLEQRHYDNRRRKRYCVSCEFIYKQIFRDILSFSEVTITVVTSISVSQHANWHSFSKTYRKFTHHRTLIALLPVLA